MRALVTTRHGGPDVLRVEERPDPEPAAGEARVAVRAAGVNFADLMARAGVYPDAPEPPCVVGYEFAGEVESVGEGVDGLSIGDRVLGGCRFGGQSELVVAPASHLLPLPDGWTFAEGAALPVNYATAYGALVRYGALRRGERVLVHAAAGGVGTAATQIAKLHHAEVFGTASAPKHDAIRGIGVDHPIDYGRDDWVARVRSIAGEERPLDLVLDPIGGRSLRNSFSLLGAGGRLVCYGAQALVGPRGRDVRRVARALLETPRFNPLRLSAASKSVIGFNLLRVWDRAGSLEDYVRPLAEWIEAGALRPVVDRTFPLERGADAHRRLHDRANIGKVVLIP